MDLFVGIDLGTTQTKATVGWFEGENLKWERLPIFQACNSLGKCKEAFKLPSVVWLDGNRVLVGEYCDRKAIDLVVGYPGSHLIRSIKREMGNDVWSVESNGFRYRPYHIAAFLLITVHRSIKRAYPKDNVISVTITIPASFSSSMRRATLDAAVLAGFPSERVKIIDEPLAAFFSPYLVNKEQPNINEPVVVFDMGGGTLDASVIRRIKAEEFELMATSRYNEIAGDDLTLEIGALILHEARKLQIKIDPISTLGFGLGLWNLAEAMKMKLSEHLKNDLNYGTFNNQIMDHEKDGDFILSELNNQFESLPSIHVFTSDLLKVLMPFFNLEEYQDSDSRSIRHPIHQALTQAKVKAKDVKYVYTTGGSSVFPPVLATLNQVFHNGIVELDPYHAVADGALYWTAMRSVGKLKIKETIFENLYLRQEGRGFVEIVKQPITVPENESLTCSPVEFPPSETQPFLPVQGRLLTVDFFRGIAVDDPLMTVAHSEFVILGRPASDGVTLDKVTSQIDSDKIFRCQLQLHDKTGPIQAEVELRSDLAIPKTRLSKLPPGTILNGEDL